MKPGLNRRQWLAAALVASGPAAVGPVWAADAPDKAPAYQVSDWPRQKPLPPFEALSLQSDPVRLSDFKGKVLVLNFWATWCAPCRSELPTLQSMTDWFGADKVAVLALNFQEAGRTVRRFLETSGIQLPAALDANGEIAKAWGVRAFPTTVLIDRQGRPRQVVQGEVDWASPVALGWVEKVLAAR